MDRGATKWGLCWNDRPPSPLDRANPMGMVCPPSSLSWSPRWRRFWGKHKVSCKLSCSLPPRSKVEGRAGVLGRSSLPLEPDTSAPALPLPKGKQRLPEEVGSSTQGRKKETFQQSPPTRKLGERCSRRRTSPGTRGSVRMPAQATFLRLSGWFPPGSPHGHLRSVTWHVITVLQLMVSIITPRQSLRSRDKWYTGSLLYTLNPLHLVVQGCT